MNDEPTPKELDALDDGDEVVITLDDGREIEATVDYPRHPNLGGRSGNGRYHRHFQDSDGRRFSLDAFHEDKNDERRDERTDYVRRTKTGGISDNVHTERVPVESMEVADG